MTSKKVRKKSFGFGDSLLEAMQALRNSKTPELPSGLKAAGQLPEFVTRHWLNFAIYYERAAVSFIGTWMATTPEDDVLINFAHQIEDEANHYSWLRKIGPDYGVNLEAFQPPEAWRFLMEDYYPKLATSIERLAAHNIVAETGALGFMEYNLEAFPEPLRELVKEIIADELYHVTFARSLLSKYCDTDAKKELAYKAAHESLRYMDEARKVFVETPTQTSR